MVEDNDKNKYTTLYYLLLKRFNRGDLVLEDFQEEEEEERQEEDIYDSRVGRQSGSTRHESQDKQFKVRESVIKRRQNSKSRDVRNSRSKNRSRYDSSKRSRHSRDESRELPTIKPNVTVKDITVEVKEKITINTTTKRIESPMHNTTHYSKRDFYLSGRGYNSRSRGKGGGSRATPHSNMGIRM